jgi:hypothetical protein
MRVAATVPLRRLRLRSLLLLRLRLLLRPRLLLRLRLLLRHGAAPALRPLGAHARKARCARFLDYRSIADACCTWRCGTAAAGWLADGQPTSA